MFLRNFNIILSRCVASAAVLLLGFALFGSETFSSIKSFGNFGTAGAHPHAGLIQGTDGALYGTTRIGGGANLGTIFRVNTEGNNYSVLHQFSAFEGGTPLGRLAQGPDGWLYGTTFSGGANGCGVVFKIATNGSGYTVLRSFTTNGLDGCFPRSGLAIASDGTLYGATLLSTNNAGTIFKLNSDGTGYTILRNFTAISGQGRNPSEIIIGHDGKLYGTTLGDALTRSGKVFRMDADGSNYTVLGGVSLPPGDGLYYHTGLIQADDGWLYGVVSGLNSGTLFRINTNGSSYTVLRSFTVSSSGGVSPDCRLLQGTNGLLFGTTTKGGTNGVGTLFSVNTNGSDYTVLHRFVGAPDDGQWPTDALLLGNDGFLYGTTLIGGTHHEGVIFRIDQQGNNYSVLWHFNATSHDGQYPAGKLAQAADGAWFGVTSIGGSRNAGTIFKLDASGANYARVHDFGGAAEDGRLPLSGLLKGNDGAFYGTTSLGGMHDGGTVFTIDAGGNNYSILHSFDSSSDGSLPSGTLIQALDGFLYGVAGAGGTNDGGTIFKLNTNGSDYTVLHVFNTNGAAGWGPVGELKLVDDVLYGTTADGGGQRAGTVFKINLDGTGFTELRSFSTNGFDARTPFAGLEFGDNGMLYGVTRFGGATNLGTVFQMDTNGNDYAVLHSFKFAGGEGHEPVSELIQRGDGALYGTTLYGGGGSGNHADDDRGTVFLLDPESAGHAVLHSFSKTSGLGLEPFGGIVESGDGLLYGTTSRGGVLGGGSIYSLGVAPIILNQPQDQFVRLQGDAAFNVTVFGGGLNFQWLFNGAPLDDSFNPFLNLSGVVRSNAGTYSVQITNLFGTMLSSNASLILQVPQVLGSPVTQPEGGLQLVSEYEDGWPIQLGDLPRFEAQVSTNLFIWETLVDSLSWSNGSLILIDSNTSTVPVRFYRVVEH